MGFWLVARCFFLDSLAARVLAKKLAPLVDGHVKVRGDFFNKSLYLRGQYEGFRVQLGTELSFGGCHLKMKPDQEIPDWAHLTLSRVGTSRTKFEQMRKNMDEWDRESFWGMRQTYLAEHVAVPTSSLPAALARLPRELTEGIVELVDGDPHGFYHVHRSELEMTVASNLVWKPRPVEIVKRRLALAAAILKTVLQAPAVEERQDPFRSPS